MADMDSHGISHQVVGVSKIDEKVLSFLIIDQTWIAMVFPTNVNPG